MSLEVEFDHPVLFRGTPKRSSGERWMVAMFKSRATVGRLTSKEAPVVAVIERSGSRSEFRSHLGQFYAKADRFSSIMNSSRPYWFGARTGLIGSMALAIRERLLLDDSGTPAPKDLLSDMAAACQFGTKWGIPQRWGNTMQRFEAFDPAAMKDYDAADIEEWRDLAVLTVERMISCADGIIVPCDEPCLVTDGVQREGPTIQGSAAIYGMRGSSTDGRWVPKDRVTSPYWSQSLDTCYPLPEWRVLARGAGGFSSDKANPSDTIKSIEVFDPGAFTFDFAGRETVRLADRLVELIGSRFTTLKGSWKKSTPRELAEEHDMLRELLTQGEIDTDRLRDTVVAVKNVIALHADAISRAGYYYAPYVEIAVSNAIARYDARPIDIGATAAMSAFSP